MTFDNVEMFARMIPQSMLGSVLEMYSDSVD